MIPVKRERMLTIRVTDEEHARLLARCEGKQLASWMRKVCLGAPPSKTSGLPTLAPPLLRQLNRPGFPGECFICELRLPDHRFRWKHNKLFLLLPEEYGPAFPAIVDCYTSPPT